MVSRNAGSNLAPVVVIVGETSSGKTALAVELAKRFNGEVICADSRTVYKGMNIGTAKPTAHEMQGIAHYGLDEVEPGEQFTAYDFQRLAYQAIEEIAERGKLPIVVGGTGLYVDAVLYGFQFRAVPSVQERATLEMMSTPALQQGILALGYDLPENATNRRHLTRLLEAGPAPQQPRRLRANTVVLGLHVATDELKERIKDRVEAMVASGLVDEVRGLVNRYSDAEALKAPGYKAVAAYIGGECSLEQAKQQFVRSDLQLAKRQRTWFKRNANIQWLDYGARLDEAVAIVTTLLAS